MFEQSILFYSHYCLCVLSLWIERLSFTGSEKYTINTKQKIEILTVILVIQDIPSLVMHAIPFVPSFLSWKCSQFFSFLKQRKSSCVCFEQQNPH